MTAQETFDHLDALSKLQALTLVESLGLQRAMGRLGMLPRAKRYNSCKWCAGDIATVVAMFRDGKTDEEIGSAVDRTASGVQGVRKTQRLRRDQKGKAIL